MSISDKDKLHKLKQIRIDNLEEKLDKDIRGYDHIMDYKKDHSAGLVTDWVDENIKIIIEKHNAEIEKVKKMKIQDFSGNDIKQVSET